jgi:hypothetical protein
MISFSTIAVLLFISVFVSGQTSSLTTTFKFDNIEEGYDHICKTQVWVNGELLGESKEVKESQGGSFTVNVPYGEHRVRIVNLAQYEGTWEEHSVANGYSIDCLWEGTHKFDKKRTKVFLLFDIDGTAEVSWKKMPAKAK